MTRPLSSVASRACLHLFVAALFADAIGIASAATPEPWTLHNALNVPDTVKLSGSVRGRYEWLDGQPRVGLDPSTDLFSFRSTLFAEYRASWLKIGGELYDSRAYPDDPGSGVSTNDVNALEPVQAYAIADFSQWLGKGSTGSVQAGRFVMNLGSRRLVAADDYRNATSGYSGVRLDLKSAAGSTATLIYTQPQVHLPDDLPSILDNDIQLDRQSSDLVLWGGIASLSTLLPATTVEAYYFAAKEHDRPDLATRNRDLHTIGLRLYRDPVAGRLDFEFEGVRQTGSVRASTAPLAPELDVTAYFYHLEAGYQWTQSWRPRLSLEYDYASGDDSGAAYGRFDTLFGMRRPDFGPSGIYSAIGRTNISAPGVRLEGALSPRLDVLVSYRALWLASRTDSFSTTGVRDVTGASGDFAGHQLDGRLRYWLIPQSLRFEVDAVILKKGRFLTDAPNAPDTGDTHYLSLNLTTIF